MKRLLWVFIFLCTATQHIYATARYHENPLSPWGVDSDLAHFSKTPPARTSYSVSSTICQKMIRFFQVYISPIDGPRSHYYPTSSQYALQAIQRYGVFTGIALGCDRLMRENAEDWVYPITSDYGVNRKLDPVR